MQHKIRIAPLVCLIVLLFLFYFAFFCFIFVRFSRAAIRSTLTRSLRPNAIKFVVKSRRGWKMCFPFAAAPPFLRFAFAFAFASLSVSASVALSLSTSTSWSLPQSLSSGSAAALAFNFVCLCSCVCIRSASTPRLALCGRRQFIFGTLTAPWLVLSHSPSYTANAVAISLWLAGVRLRSHTHTAAPGLCSLPLSACVLVCACV